MHRHRRGGGRPAGRRRRRPRSCPRRCPTASTCSRPCSPTRPTTCGSRRRRSSARSRSSSRSTTRTTPSRWRTTTGSASGPGVWTSDLARAHRVADRITAGMVWVNDHHRLEPSLPWGGVKESGTGKDAGTEIFRRLHLDQDRRRAHRRRRRRLVRVGRARPPELSPIPLALAPLLRTTTPTKGPSHVLLATARRAGTRRLAHRDHPQPSGWCCSAPRWAGPSTASPAASTPWSSARP